MDLFIFHIKDKFIRWDSVLMSKSNVSRRSCSKTSSSRAIL